eukprot:TRINITY_DN36672_c0_g1_i1.p1 TRINITY_DN36672_c0_g1~~TRINITY_DN36672_c0_g1_i1.p1  ORF type:complete len:491 (+),score=80.56 TRINITY_DN36672_c0_g1_i1:49-1473(+)
MTVLITEILLEIFPYLPPQKHGSLSLVCKRWAEMSIYVFRHHLAWRKTGKCLHLLDSSPPGKTLYHLVGDHCFTLTRENLPFTDSKMTLSKTRLSKDGETASDNPRKELMTLRRVLYCVMHDDMLLVLATHLVEVYSLLTGQVMYNLKPTESQMARGVKFTNILSLHGSPGKPAKLVCKMRPGNADTDSNINMYTLATGECTVWTCSLKRVRSCQMTGKYIVMKGYSGTEAEAVAININTGAQVRNQNKLFVNEGSQKDVRVIGVDSSNVAYFVQPKEGKSIPGAWHRWSDRLLNRPKARDQCFEIVKWDIPLNTVTTETLSTRGIPAPCGSIQPFTLTLDKDKCNLCDSQSVIITFFNRTPTTPVTATVPPTPQQIHSHGILCVFTKFGQLLSTLDPTTPSMKRLVVFDNDGESSDKSDQQETDEMSMEFLSAHRDSQQLLFSMTRRTEGETKTRVLAQTYECASSYAAPGFL